MGGLVNKIKENKDKITGAIESVVPMTEEQKEKLHAAVNDPTSIMPTSVQRVVQVAKNAEQYKEKAIASLPISEAQKTQLRSAVNSVQEKVVKRVMHSPPAEAVTVETAETADAPIQLTLTPHDTNEPHITILHTHVVTKEASSEGSQ